MRSVGTWDCHRHNEVKIVILGAKYVGKSAMAFCYWLRRWPKGRDDDPWNFEAYIPRVGSEEQLSREMPDTGRRLYLQDTPGTGRGFEENERYISLTYPGADAFIIAYAVDKYVGVECE